MTALTLPVEPGEAARQLQGSLARAGFEVPIVEWPVLAARELIAQDRGGRARTSLKPAVLVRVSAHLYNGIEDYDALAEILDRLIG